MKTKTANYLVADLFCGAGGSSTGAERAVRDLGARMTLVCINHWPVAIETHARNHPTARHYIEDVTVADPERLVPEGRLDLLMASPECRYYSRARGGKPVHDQGRMNPWAVHRWITALDVRCLLIENVPEFVDWGPLLPSGLPDPERKGLFFQAWINALWKLGYNAEWRMLNAADFGDATTRTRFFLIGRKDGRPVRWPAPTHSATGAEDMIGRLERWRAAREIIDWSNPGRSLLDDPHYQRRPLSEKTQRRIARGLEKFGGPLAPFYIRLLDLDGDAQQSPGGDPAAPGPFIMGKQGHNPAYRGVDGPVPTVTTDGAPYLIEPVAEAFVLGQQSLSAARNVKDPLPTIATHGAISLTKPLLVKYYGTGVCHPTDEPVPTITTKDRIGLVQPFIVQNRIRPDGDRVYDIEKPCNTITGHGAGALVSPVMVEVNHGGEDDRTYSVDRPLKTITTNRYSTALVNPLLVDHKAKLGSLHNPIAIEVTYDAKGDPHFKEPLNVIAERNRKAGIGPFMVQWDQTGSNGNCVRGVDAPLATIVTKQNTGIVEPMTIPYGPKAEARSVEQPLHTVMTKDRLGLAEPVLQEVPAGAVDPRRLVTIDGEMYYLDLRFRMLTNLELARAMGFTDDESTYEFVGNISEVTRQIGNAVPVNLAKALVKSILEKSCELV